MANIQTMEYLEPTSRTLYDWTPDRVRAAWITAQSGNLRMAADLCEELLGDDGVIGPLGSRASGLLKLPQKFEAADGATRRTPILRAIEADWWDANTEDEVRELQSWAILLGVCPAQLVWAEGKGGRAIPKLSYKNPKYLSFDNHSRAWKYETTTGVVDVVAGNGVWVLHTPFSAKRPWSRGIWRALAYWWLLKRYAMTDWARYGEAHGSPTTVGYVPESKGANPEYRNEVARRLKEMGANRSIALPPGFDVKLLEATANTWGTFKAQIDMADSGMAIAILGQNLTSKVKEGSFAAANIHQEVRTDIIISDGRALDTTLHNQQWMWWSEFNFGDRKITPWAEFDTTPPTDLTAQAETMNKVADAVVKLEGKGADVKKILERFGIPMLEEAPNTNRAKFSAKKPDGFTRGQINADVLADTALRNQLTLHKK